MYLVKTTTIHTNRSPKTTTNNNNNNINKYFIMTGGVINDTYNTASTSTTSTSDNNNIEKVFVTNAINEMKHQFYIQQLQSMKDDLQYATSRCQQIHSANMVKIPRTIKCMKINEFNSLYNCNLLLIVDTIKRTNNHKNNNNKQEQNQQQSSLSNLGSSSVSVLSSISSSQSQRTLVAETPAAANRSNTSSNKTMQTPSRTVRKGRQTTNGDLVATVTKKNKRGNGGNGPVMFAPQTEMGISVGDGMIVPLNDEECIKELDSNVKSNALDQVMILQEQLAKIVTLLQK